MNKSLPTTQLIDTLDISKMLGVSRQHVVARMTKRPDFPKPCINISQRLRRWRKEDVMKWAMTGGKS